MIRVLGALVVTALTVGGWLWLAVQGGAALPKRTECRVGYVYDGDTVEMICGARDYAARIIGLDAPETKEPRCAAEQAAGKRATERLRQLVRQGPVSLRRQGYDRYGRPLIRMWVGGEDVASVLVGEGLAARYRGGQRPDWCARLSAVGGGQEKVATGRLHNRPKREAAGAGQPYLKREEA